MPCSPKQCSTVFLGTGQAGKHEGRSTEHSFAPGTKRCARNARSLSWDAIEPASSSMAEATLNRNRRPFRVKSPCFSALSFALPTCGFRVSSPGAAISRMAGGAAAFGTSVAHPPFTVGESGSGRASARRVPVVRRVRVVARIKAARRVRVVKLNKRRSCDEASIRWFRSWCGITAGGQLCSWSRGGRRRGGSAASVPSSRRLRRLAGAAGRMARRHVGVARGTCETQRGPGPLGRASNAVAVAASHPWDGTGLATRRVPVGRPGAGSRAGLRSRTGWTGSDGTGLRARSRKRHGLRTGRGRVWSQSGLRPGFRLGTAAALVTRG